MATLALQALEAVRSTTGGPPLVLSFQEGATQVFKKGDLLIFTSGQVTLAGADPTSIVGIAAMDATGVQGSMIQVWLANSGNIFVGSRGTVSGATFTGTAAGTAFADVGTVFGLTRASTPTLKWAVDSSKTTAQATNGSTSRVIVVATDPRDVAGTDTGARLQFIFLDITGTTSTAFVRAFSGL